MKFLVPNYSYCQNPRLGGYLPQILVLSVLCPQLNLLNHHEQNSWVRHCTVLVTQSNSYSNFLRLGTTFAKYSEYDREVTASVF